MFVGLAKTDPYVPNGVSGGDFVPWPDWVPAVDAGYMPAFWKRNRGAHDDRWSGWHPSMVEAAGEAPRRQEDSTAPNARVLANDDDWQQINDLLANESPQAGTSPSEQSIRAAVSAVAGLRATLTSEVLPAGPVIDQVIDLWAATHEVGPDVARPAESLLTALVGRDRVRAAEVTSTCDLIEAALMAVQIPPNGEPVKAVSGRLPRQRTGARPGT